MMKILALPLVAMEAIANWLMEPDCIQEKIWAVRSQLQYKSGLFVN